MKALVTSKGQVTIPKDLRDKFGIQPGTQVDFAAAEDGIRLRKVVDRSKKLGVLGCLKKELADRSVMELMDDLRGQWSCRRSLPGKESADERRRGRHLRVAGDLQRRTERRIVARVPAIGGRGGVAASLVGGVCGSSVVFPIGRCLSKALRDLELRHSPLTEETSLLAGKIFRTYRNEGGPRKTILPDFLVAAHAANQADSLATDDRGYLRTYFPSIRLLSLPKSP